MKTNSELTKYMMTSQEDILSQDSMKHEIMLIIWLMPIYRRLTYRYRYISPPPSCELTRYDGKSKRYFEIGENEVKVKPACALVKGGTRRAHCAIWRKTKLAINQYEVKTFLKLFIYDGITAWNWFFYWYSFCWSSSGLEPTKLQGAGLKCLYQQWMSNF